MRMRLPFPIGAAGLLASTAVRLWMRGLDYKIAYYDPTIDPVRADCSSRKIYIFWHENILIPLYLRGHCNLAMLLSRHRDGDVLSRVAEHLGFQCVRGSTYRGAVPALRELQRRGRRMHLTMTPDGPRGPRRRMAPGPIYLASKLAMPLVLLGFGYDRPMRMNTWDRFAIPRPFSRARAIISPPITIPPNLDSAGIEQRRRSIEALLTHLTEEAEAWAASRSYMAGQQPLARQARRISRPHATVDSADVAADAISVTARPWRRAG